MRCVIKPALAASWLVFSCLATSPVRAATSDRKDTVAAAARVRAIAGSIDPLPETGSGITRDVGEIAVIEFDQRNYDKSNGEGSGNFEGRIPVARRFYKDHGDNYDFLVVFTNFEFDSGPAIAFYNGVRNDVRGGGNPIFDNGDLFGSPSRLRGYIDMAALSRYKTAPQSLDPADPGFQRTVAVMFHEIGHHWLAKPRYEVSPGVVSSDLLFPDGAHWSALLDSDASFMYGSDWVRDGSGTYRAAHVEEAYSALDLYLMGFLPPDRVPDITLLRKEGANTGALPVEGAALTAVPETITIGQVTAAEGPLSPDHLHSQKDFRVGFIFLARGNAPSAADLAAVDRIREAFAAAFFALTRGVAFADTTLAETPLVPRTSAADLDNALSWLLARQSIDGRWEDVPATSLRDTAVVLEALHRLGATGAGSERGRLWLQAASSTNLDFAARRAAGLTLFPTTAEDQASLAAPLLAAQNPDGGFGPGSGFESDPLDTALVLRALAALGRPADNVVRTALEYLETAASASGGWPVIAGGEPSTVVTAQALLALADWKATNEAGRLFAGATAALLRRQNLDGGFGESPSTPYATALSVHALLGAGAPPALVDRGVAWLESAQLEEGSWDGSPYQTALALLALRGGLAPNLTIPADSVAIDPPSPREGQPVQVTARVRNSGRAPAPASRVRLFDGDPTAGAVIAESLVPALAGQEEAPVSFTMATDDRAGTLTLFLVADPDNEVAEAREDDNTAVRSFRIDGLAPDLALAPGDMQAAPYPPTEGEVVEVRVTVRNSGAKSAPASLLRLFDGDPRAAGQRIGEASVPALALGGAATVTFAWDTSGKRGDHVLWAVANADYRVADANPDNNALAFPVSVRATLAGVDLAVADARATPAVLALLPAEVELAATVRNLGSQPVQSHVALYDTDQAGSAPLFDAPVSLGPRSEQAVSFPLLLSHPGSRHLRFVADPDGLTADEDRTNNSADLSVRDPGNTLDLEVLPSGVHASASDLIVGERLTVTAEVRNRGTAAVAQVPVVLVHEPNGPAAELARALVTLGPGEAATVSLGWTTAFTGDAIPLVVRADPFNLLAEVSEANNEAAVVVRVRPSALPDLTVSSADIRIVPDPPVEGGSATVSAVVCNPSPVDAGTFSVYFYRNPESGGVNIAPPVEVAALGASSCTTVSVVWSPVDVRGAQGVFVEADGDSVIEEYDEDDNIGFRPFSVLGLPDLVLAAADVSLDPGYPRAGEPVTVRAVVRNLGAQASAATVLSGFEGEPGSGTPIGGAEVPAIAPGELTSVEFVWNPAGAPGTRTLTLVLDPGDQVRELDEGNNRVRRTVAVQDADLYLTEPYFSPNGDGVKDETVLAYRAAGVTSVAVANDRGQTVRRLGSEAPLAGTATWDGRDDTGGLLPDGAYRLSLQDANGHVLGRATAVLDTNRSPIHDAAGTGQTAVHNLTCALPELASADRAWTPAEDAVLFILRFPHPPFSVGLVRVGPDGEISQLVADPWYSNASFDSYSTASSTSSAISPDGREALISGQVVDLATGARRPSPPGRFPAWSPDGGFITAGTSVVSRDGVLVGTLPGGGDFIGRPWAWSPAGDQLAAGNQIVRRDGSLVTEVPLPAGIPTGRDSTFWRGDGQILASLGSCGGDGCHSVRAVKIDPLAGTAVEVPEVFGSWSPDGSKLARTGIHGSAEVTEVVAEDGTSPAELVPFTVRIAPRSMAALFSKSPGEAKPGEVCPGHLDDLFALTHLLNLRAELAAVPLPGNRGVLLLGTAADRNLERFQLDFARADVPEVWHPIGAASEVPVADDVLTAWVPPGPGTFLVRLRVDDRAGNTRTTVRVVSWDRVPALTNFTQSETLFSPNDDGVKDAVVFRYVVMEPTVARVRILAGDATRSDGAALPVVRSLEIDYPQIGPASFTWDGRDAAGEVVPDGRYTVLLNGVPFRVEVDSTPPDIGWRYERLRSEKHRVGKHDEGRMLADRVWHVVDPHLKSWTLAPGLLAGEKGAYEPVKDADGSIVYDGGIARVARDGGRVVDLREEDEDVGTLGNQPSAEFVAEDLAGNVSRVPVSPVQERLYLLEIGVGGALAAAPPFDPVPLPPVYRLLPRDTSFKLGSTVRATGVLRFQHQLASGGAWTDVVVGGADPDFTAMGLAADSTYRGRFAQAGASGDVFSEAFLFRICRDYLKLAMATESTANPNPIPGTDQARYTFTLVADTAEPVSGAVLTVHDGGSMSATASMSRVDARTFRGTIVAPLRNCPVSPHDVLTFAARALGANGQTYVSNGICGQLTVAWPQCGSVFTIEQETRTCSESSPDRLFLGVVNVGGLPPSPGSRLTVEGFPPEGPFTLADVDLDDGRFKGQLVVDVTGRPEGELPIRARIGPPGLPPEKQTGLATAFIDRTPPVVDWLAPAEGETVCVALAPQPPLLTLLTRADDHAHDLEVSVEQRGGSGSWQPIPRFCDGSHDPCPAGPGFQTTGSPATTVWYLHDTPSGEYTSRLNYCDGAGNRTSLERHFTLRRDIPVLSFKALPRSIFSPNGDGHADFAVLTAFSLQHLFITAVVTSGKVDGPVVRTLLAQPREPGDTAVAWDGQRDTGGVVPDGEYQIVVDGRDDCGNTTRISVPVTVDDTPPAVGITAPASGTVLAASVDVRGLVTDQHIVSYELTYGIGAEPASWLPVATGVGGVAGGLLGRWDTPRAEGPYTLRLVAVDRAENQAETRVAVSVRPGNALRRLGANPALFSPNGDGRRETTTVEYELESPSKVWLQVRSLDALVLRTFETGLSRAAGTFALVWDGKTDAGTPAPEGELALWIRVEDPTTGAAQEQTVAVEIDRTSPLLALTTPAPDGFVSRETAVHGTIDDQRLTEYVVTVTPAAGSAVELARGAQSRANADLASLSALPDGPYTLSVTATDAAENRTQVDRAFTVDSAPPSVALVAPADGSTFARGPTPIEIRAKVVDANLDEYTLGFGIGPQPSALVELARGTTGGTGLVASWPVASVPDGLYTLVLTARDRAGHVAEARAQVTVDSLAPEARISSPAEGESLKEARAIRGTVTDATLASWTLESAPGNAATAYQWATLASGTAAVADDSLASWVPLPPDGVHTLRLTARDRAGHTTSAFRSAIIDTTPPAPPAGLAASVEHGTGGLAEIHLTWLPGVETDLAGYRVSRDDLGLTPSVVDGLAFTDSGRPDGTFHYRVYAVDRAGNASAPASLTVRADVTPPLASLLRPLAGAVVSGSVEIQGTAFSPDDFKEYRLLVAVNSTPTSWTTIARSSVPVAAGRLGTWTATVDGPWVIALEAEDRSGNVAKASIPVDVDTEPPSAPVLDAVATNASQPTVLTLTWQPSPSVDVAGYLVYRNGRVAGVSALALGDLRPYLVPGPAYTDLGLPDGRHCYWIVAMDQAGNLSPPSNEACGQLDNRAPRATIVRPANGARFGRPIELLAESPDRDVASVQFQIAPSSTSDWRDLSGAVTREPFATVLDPASLDPGSYDLRAVATDETGHVDSSAPAIRVVYGDVTPPGPPQRLVAHVDGLHVSFSWQANTEPDVASYRLYRDGALRISTVDPAATDSSSTAGQFEYTVTAVDQDGNEGAHSDSVGVRIAILQLDPPAYPVVLGTGAVLSGSGSMEGQSVQVLRDDAVVGETTASRATFRVEGVALVPDGNVLRARATDGLGNRTDLSNPVVVISNEAPAALTSLAATAIGREVDLTWDPAPEPDVFGYLVREDDRLLTASTPQTEAASLSPAGAQGAFDGDPTTFWQSSTGQATWTVTFPAPVLVDRVRLRFTAGSTPPPDYQLLAAWQGTMLPLVRARGNDQGVVEHVLPQPFAADTLSLRLESPGKLAEVSVFRLDVVPVGTATLHRSILPDGRHRYLVSAIDRYGAEGTTTAVEAAIGDVEAPAAPVGLLAGVVDGAVVLSWTPNGEADVAAYVVSRNGLPIATTTGAGYRDAGLPASTYRYTVRAVDHSGNESPESAPVEVTVSPTAPGAPVILAPTDAAHPLAWTSLRADVGGRAEAGAVVLLDRNEAPLASTIAARAMLPRGRFPLPLGARFPILSPDGRRMAWDGYVDGGQRIFVDDLLTGEISSIQQGTDAASPAFSPSGQRLAFFSRDDNGAVQQVFVFDLATGERTPVLDAAAYVSEIQWSPDETGLALAVYGPEGFEIRLLDLPSSASRRLLTGAAAFLRWSPDGRRIAFIRGWQGAAELHVVDIVTAIDTTLDYQPSASSPPSWSPDSRRIAFTSAAGPLLRVVVRDLETGATEVHEATGNDALDARFGPAGDRLSFVGVTPRPPDDDDTEPAETAPQEQRIYVDDLTTGERLLLSGPTPLGEDENEKPFANDWLPSGRLAISVAGQVALFDDLPGAFLFKDLPLLPGDNRLVARAVEPSAGLVGPDSEPVTLTVPDGLFPDPAVSASDLSAYPSFPLVGQAVVLSVLVRNLGRVAARDVPITVTLSDPTGATVFEHQALLTEVAAGGSTLVSVPWTPSRLGVHRLHARLDGALAEARTDNDEAERDVVVLAAGGWSVGVQADRTQYPAESPALLGVRLTNAGPSSTGRAQTTVTDGAGHLVAVLDTRSLALTYGETAAYAVPWNTGRTYAGDNYAFHVRVVDQANPDEALGEASSPFAITPDVRVDSRIVPNETHVAENRTATFVGRVQNLGRNAPLDSLVARLRILRDGTAVYQADRAVPRLLPSASWEATFEWPSASPAAAYLAQLAVLDTSGAVLANRSAPFEVRSAPVPMAGSLAVVPADLLPGDPYEIRLTLTNASGAPLLALPVVVEVVSGADAAVAQSESLSLDLAPGETREATLQLAATGFSPGPFTARLRAGIPEQTLARALFRVHGAITAPSLDAPAAGSRLATSHPTLSVNNAVSAEGAPLRYAYQLYGDAALSQELQGVGDVPEGEGRTSLAVPFNLLEDQTYFWRARATDGFSTSAWTGVGSFTVDEVNEPPTNPLPDSPWPGTSVASLQPLLTIQNSTDVELDPITYEFRLATGADMAVVIASASGIAEQPGLTSWRVPMSLQDDAVYYWSARASDGFQLSSWSVPVSFRVDASNVPPSAPAPLRPAPGATVTTLRPELGVGPAQDPEGDDLTYVFQVDRAPSFDSPQVSPFLPSSAGEIAWTPPVDLADNTSYFWRAAASDGHTQGPWAGGSFFVNLVNEAPGVPALLDPTGGAAVGTPTPTLRIRNTTDPDHDALVYDFTIMDAAGNAVAEASGVASGVDETSWSIPAETALLENHVYTWIARARDAALAGGWSAPAAFRVNAIVEPPTAPTLDSPREGATVQGRRPALAVANALSPDGLGLTYAFELYADGQTEPIAQAAGIAEGAGHTTWDVPADLADGGYAWRARALDTNLQPGPWMDTAHFRVDADRPPAPPVGLSATPGDQTVSLAWTASGEAGVVAYRVYRGPASEGPFGFVAEATAPSIVDVGLVNGVTVYYVVTARGDRFESARSAVVAATPFAPAPTEVAVRYSPAVLSAECVLGRFLEPPVEPMAAPGVSDEPPVPDDPTLVQPFLNCVADNTDGTHTAYFGYFNPNDLPVTLPVGAQNHFYPGPENRGQPTTFGPGRTTFPWGAFTVAFGESGVSWAVEGGSATASISSPRCSFPPPSSCPAFILATVEPPQGYDAASIDVASVRLGGSVAADPSYRRLGDADADGLPEVEMRFARSAVAPLLGAGENRLTLTGGASAAAFTGSAVIRVDPPVVGLKVTPPVLNRRVNAGDVTASLTFVPGIQAANVEVGSLLLNEIVPIHAVILRAGNRLVVSFSRKAVNAVLPAGEHVEVRVSGRLRGLPFVARDLVRVVD